MDIIYKIIWIFGKLLLNKWAFLYLIIINITALIAFYADKQKAIKHTWRIPEATLLTIAFIGGSFGAYAGMKLFRHKTKHPKFYITIPVFMILHFIIIILGIWGKF